MINTAGEVAYAPGYGELYPVFFLQIGDFYGAPWQSRRGGYLAKIRTSLGGALAFSESAKTRRAMPT